jgi:hypothetical protein
LVDRLKESWWEYDGNLAVECAVVRKLRFVDEEKEPFYGLRNTPMLNASYI